jgi:hypothetical protein
VAAFIIIKERKRESISTKPENYDSKIIKNKTVTKFPY